MYVQMVSTSSSAIFMMLLSPSRITWMTCESLAVSRLHIGEMTPRLTTYATCSDRPINQSINQSVCIKLKFSVIRGRNIGIARGLWGNIPPRIQHSYGKNATRHVFGLTVRPKMHFPHRASTLPPPRQISGYAYGRKRIDVWSVEGSVEQVRLYFSFEAGERWSWLYIVRQRFPDFRSTWRETTSTY